MTEGSLPIRQTQCFENPSKVLSFESNGTHANFQFWFLLEPHLLPENRKYCLKPGKPTSLGILNNISLRFQKKSHTSSKINQKQTFWAQIGHKLQSKAMSKGYQKFSHSL